jgi:hypothetical protein
MRNILQPIQLFPMVLPPLSQISAQTQLFSSSAAKNGGGRLKQLLSQIPAPEDVEKVVGI